MKAGVISEKMFGLRGSPNDVGPGPGHGNSTFFIEYARENVEKFVQQCGEIFRRTVWDIYPRGNRRAAPRTDDVQELL